MNIILYWLGRGWSAVRNFAPWKAIFLSWLIEYIVLILLDVVLILLGKPLFSTRSVFGFLFHVCLFMGIYVWLYNKLYPNGWGNDRKQS